MISLKIYHLYIYAANNKAALKGAVFSVLFFRITQSRIILGFYCNNQAVMERRYDVVSI